MHHENCLGIMQSSFHFNKQFQVTAALRLKTGVAIFFLCFAREVYLPLPNTDMEDYSGGLRESINKTNSTGVLFRFLKTRDWWDGSVSKGACQLA